MFAAVAWDKLNIPPVDEFSKDPTVPYRPKINMATVCKGRVHPDDVEGLQVRYVDDGSGWDDAF